MCVSCFLKGNNALPRGHVPPQQTSAWASFRNRALKLRLVRVSCFLKGTNAILQGQVLLQQTCTWGSFRKKSPQIENHVCLMVSKAKTHSFEVTFSTAVGLYMGLFQTKKALKLKIIRLSCFLKGENALLRGHVFYCCRLEYGVFSTKEPSN